MESWVAVEVWIKAEPSIPKTLWLIRPLCPADLVSLAVSPAPPFCHKAASLFLPNSCGCAFPFYLSLKCPLLGGLSRPPSLNQILSTS